MRILQNIILLCAVLIAPAWLTALVALYGFVRYPHYVESVFAFILFDLLYAGATLNIEMNPAIILPLSFYALLTYAIATVIRGRIREQATSI